MATINPFQGPINYSIDVQSPFESALGGFKLGSDVATIQATQKKRELETEALAQAQQRQTDLANLFKNPNATSADYARVSAFLPKDQAAIVTQGFEAQTKEQQQNTLRSGAQVYTAIKSGNLPVAEMRLKEQAEALRRAGKEKEAQGFDDLSNLIRLNPTGAQTTIALTIAGLPGGKDFLDNADKALSTVREEALQPSKLKEAVADADKAVADKEKAVFEAKDTPARLQAEQDLRVAQAKKVKIEADYKERQELATLEKSNWDVKNLKSQINDRARQLNLRSQEVAATVAEKLASAGAKLNEVPADTKKLINESAVAAATSKQSAGQFNDLAKRLEAEGGGYGVFSSASDYLKRGVGFQGGITQLRQEYTRLRNTAAIKSLPPGPATDRDIALALRGFPSENASASDLSSFLRGMAKLQDIDASINNAKTDWLTNNNGSLARAKNTFVAGDYAAKAGENFNDFSTRIIDDVTKKYDPRTQTSVVDQIPTPRTPQPRAAENSVRSAADAILRKGL
jgi:hypothetical protein